MADRFTQFLMHPATQMAAGIMAGSDPEQQGLGGVGQGIMAAGTFAQNQQKLAEARRLAGRKALMSDYSKSPTYFRDPVTGQLRVGQLGPQGDINFPDVPEGLEAVRPVTQLQTGAETFLLPQGVTDPTAPGVGRIRREVPPEQRPELKRAQTQATTESRMQTERREDALARLPRATLSGQRILERLDALRQHPGLASSTGWSTVWPVLPGSSRQDFIARMDEITGGTFLQGYEMLKGGGPITDVEGRKAEAAINRMNAATNEKDFLAAMDDYAQAVSDGVWLLQDAAGRKTTGLEIPWRGGGGKKAGPVSGSGTGRLSRRQRRERLEAIRRERGR